MSRGLDDSIEIELEPLGATGEHAVRVLDRFAGYDVLGRLAISTDVELLVARERGLSGARRLLTLKVMRPRAARDPERARSFERDARVALRLKHPGLCAAYRAGTEKGVPFVALELVHGLSVRDLIDRAGERGEVLVPAIASSIAAAVADALDAGHLARARAADVLPGPHADLRADEVMIALDGTVKVLATPRDAESDVFALGLLLHEMVTGRRPSARALDARQRTWPRAVPAWLAPVLDHALADDPADRYPSAAALRDDLLRAAGAGADVRRASIAEAVLAVNEIDGRTSPTPERAPFVPLRRGDATGRPVLAPRRRPARVSWLLVTLSLLIAATLALALAVGHAH